MKNVFFLALLSEISLLCSAQADSITFAAAKWNVKKIKPGVFWKHYEFQGDLFGSSQSINILEIRNKGKRKIDLGFEKQLLKPTSEFGKESKAIAALNGTFFDVKNGGSVDYIKSNDQVICENRLLQNGSRTVHQRAAIVLKNGKLTIEKWNENDEWETGLMGEDVMLSAPLLVYKMKQEPIDTTAFAKTRHPRTAVAVTKNRILLLTVDGRDEHAAGMTLPELAKTLKWLGATDGINLDGGGSTTLWIYNQPENGVVNYPCDDKVWNHAGERRVANVLLLKME